MGERRSKFDNRVTSSKGVLIGDSVRVDNLSFHEEQTLDDEATHYAEVGLRYLECRCYPAAAKALQESIQRCPGDALLHYSFALAQLDGRRPKALPTRQVQPVEDALEQALALRIRDGRPALLLAFVRYDHYLLNHRRVRGVGVSELVGKARRLGLTNEHLSALALHVPILPFVKRLGRV